MEQDVGLSPGRDKAEAGAERPIHSCGDIEPVDTAHGQQHVGSEKDQTDVSAFSRLPSEVIEHILYIVDANSFASLALLNREWRRVSDSPQLYAYHLSRCPSFSLTRDIISGSVSVDDLPVLKGRFACEIRRNAFEVFLRPRKTLVKLISASVSSSTAFPHGEAFRFSFSTNGQTLLCISSSRIFVVDLTSHPATVKHELKTLRRPLGATILDDGRLLAVISSKHQVNIYSLSDDEAKHIQALLLNDIPRALTLSPTGSVLAIAYDGSIEVYALGENAPTAERRAVRCVGVDSISFSSDGTMLLGSSTDVNRTNIVSISAPFYADTAADATARDAQSRMWTTQILFPDIIPGYSHVSLLPLHAEGEGSWVIGYDKHIKAFRAVKINNARTGVTYFVGPGPGEGSEEPKPLTIPAADSWGELVVLGFQDSGLWLYGLPDRIDIAPLSSPTMETNGTRNPSQALVDRRWDGLSAWGQDNSQRLQRMINQPSMLLTGHKVTDIPGIAAARWVLPPRSAKNQGLWRHRLVAVAPGGVNSSALGEENVPIDGGRILVLDFERSTKDGEVNEITIEAGETAPKTLREQSPSLDTEVELERRRTQLRRPVIGSPRNSLVQRQANAARESFPTTTGSSQKLLSNNQRGSRSQPSSPVDIDSSDNAHILDSPYSNTQPRSRDTLHRAATAAAASRGRHNPRYRGTINTTEPEQQIPHESDADGWVPPPPPYTREPDAPLPEDLRRLLLPAMTEPVQRVGDVPPQVRRAHASRLDTMAQDAMTRSHTVVERMNTVSSSRLALGRRRTSRESSKTGSVGQSGRQRNVLQKRREPPPAINPPSAGAQAQTRTMQISTQSSVQDNLPSSVPATADNIPQVHSSYSLQRTLPPGHVAEGASSTLAQAGPSMDSLLRSSTRESSDIALQGRTHLPPPSHSEPPSDLSANPPPPPTVPQSANPERRKSQYRTRSFAARLLSPKNQRTRPSSPLPVQGVARQSLSSDRMDGLSARFGGNGSLAGYHSFSMSSPELRFQPSGSGRLETIPSARSRSGFQGLARSRSRSHDIRSPMGLAHEAVPGSTARISTDPIDPRPSHDAQPEDWRERIEQWNIRTIDERRRKGQGKCFVM
ncbi:hypothetical protein VTN00DRAFT_617 [Thermoascus crustaceus]|uniref:uncharacterized protein n=1 Tax=Thermoascus crustaceus TaxID=5088 RepID=UPI003744AF02